jgi:hypothetical protein
MPGVNVEPPRSLGAGVAGVLAAVFKNAVVRSFWAARAWASATSVVPELCTPGGKPVTAVPGAKPMSPEITVEPVLVIVVPASTAKLDAVPRLMAVGAAAAG